MKDVLLSSGDVCELADMRPATFGEWNDKGIVVPVEGGKGHGSHRRFTPLQAVGIAVGVELRNSDRGCQLDYIRRVVSAFATVTPEELMVGFLRNQKYFVTEHRGRVLLIGEKHGGLVDVEKIYGKVLKQIKRMSKAKPNPTGRNRGLVSSK